MAVDIFLKLEGVKGESQDHKYKEEIDISAWTWGMTQSASTHSGSGGGAGKVSVQDIHITKTLDKASPTLMKFCANGKHIAKGQIIVRKAGEKPLEYIKIEFEEILVTNYSVGGAAASDLISENISLNFAKFKKTYTPQSKDGSAHAAVEHKWNIAQNKSE